MSDDNQNAEANASSSSSDDISDRARKLITEANNEAAKYRTQKNSIEAETSSRLKAEFDEQFKSVSDNLSAVTAERDSASGNYNKLVAALSAGVPGDTAVEFAALLQGNTPEEFKEHAEKLKGMFGAGGRVKAVDPSHGFNGSSSSTPEDALAALFKASLSKK